MSSPSKALRPGKLGSEARALRRTLINQMRGRGRRGQPIVLHRALAARPFPPQRWWTVAGLPLACSLVVFFGRDWIAASWWMMIQLGMAFSGLPGEINWSHSVGGMRLGFGIPVIEANAGAPTNLQWWLGIGLTSLAVLVSFVLPSRSLPIAYALRLAALVLAASLTMFLLLPETFPYALPDHVSTLLYLALLYAGLAPWLLALTFNILDFPPITKVMLTLSTTAFVLLMAPFHSVAHAVILHYGSLLYQPMLFLLFGLFPFIMATVAFYAYAMTSRTHAPGAA